MLARETGPGMGTETRTGTGPRLFCEVKLHRRAGWAKTTKKRLLVGFVLNLEQSRDFWVLQLPLTSCLLCSTLSAG